MEHEHGAISVRTLCPSEVAANWTFDSSRNELLLYQQGCTDSTCGGLGGKTWLPIELAPSAGSGDFICLERWAIEGAAPGGQCRFQISSHPRHPLLVDRCSYPDRPGSRLELSWLDSRRPRALQVPELHPESWVFHPNEPALLMNLGESWTRGIIIPDENEVYASDIRVVTVEPAQQRAHVATLPELSRWMLGLQRSERLGPDRIVVEAKLHPRDFARFDGKLIVYFVLDDRASLQGWLSPTEHHMAWAYADGQYFELLREVVGANSTQRLTLMPVELRSLPE